MDTKQATHVIICRDAKSPFWMAQFTAPDGSRRRRSTKVPVEGGFFQGEKLSRYQAKNRALAVAWQLANEAAEECASPGNISVRDLCRAMLEGKLGRVSMATYENARYDYNQFCRWLGGRADKPARLVTRADMKAWVLARRAQVRHKTCCKALTAIRAAFAWAVDAELMDRNPCDGVRVPPDSREEKVVKEAFTLQEVRLLMDKLPDEWASAVHCCMGTFGQRLGDIVSLRWDQFDWAARVVRIVTGKTGRVLCQPMLPGFFAWARARFLAAQKVGGEGGVWVHPRLRRLSNPSAEFTQLVRLHGIGLSGNGGGGARKCWHSKTFHSLRATCATLLQASGVSQGLAMELVGHESADVHAVYIRPTAEQLRLAAGSLPDLWAGEVPEPGGSVLSRAPLPPPPDAAFMPPFPGVG